MRLEWLFVLLAGSAVAAPDAPVAPKPPQVLSVHPYTGQKGTTFTATFRGSYLKEALSIFCGGAPFKTRIEGIEPEPEGTTPSKGKTKIDLVRVQVEIPAEAKPGRYPVRLVTPHGISNALPLHVSEHTVLAEPDGAHETAESAVAIREIPAVFTGRIYQRGEVDAYAFVVKAGQTLTFEAISGLPAPGAPGGNARGFDPSLTVYEPSGSWFDPQRLNRLAFNDEPLWVIGQPTDARLVHTFAKGGRYLLRVEAFSGQGGPDYTYQLRILPGVGPVEASLAIDWAERLFTRRLSPDRLNEVAERGGKSRDQKYIETYRATAAGTEPAPLFKLPGTLEGVLGDPGEAHRARFQLDGPQDIAIEVETPVMAPPEFNPIVRLLNRRGEEVATNVLAGRGACTGAMFKSIQAKTIVPLRDPGEYTVEIRETTADLAGPDFRYRVLVRPQIPHVGQVKIEADAVNLAPGEAKTVRVVFDREEDYRGAIAVAAESLPPGVQALTGADYEPDKDPPMSPGKRERYTPRTERTVVVFTASAGAAPMKQPQIARLAVRPIVNGKPGAVVAAKEIPMMVVAKP